MVIRSVGLVHSPTPPTSQLKLLPFNSMAIKHVMLTSGRFPASAAGAEVSSADAGRRCAAGVAVPERDLVAPGAAARAAVGAVAGPVASIHCIAWDSVY